MLWCGVQVSLRVDGSDPGYSLIYSGLNPVYTSVFQGWLQQSGVRVGWQLVVGSGLHLQEAYCQQAYGCCCVIV